MFVFVTAGVSAKIRLRPSVFNLLVVSHAFWRGKFLIFQGAMMLDDDSMRRSLIARASRHYTECAPLFDHEHGPRTWESIMNKIRGSRSTPFLFNLFLVSRSPLVSNIFKATFKPL